MRRPASFLTLIGFSSLFLLPASSATETEPIQPAVESDQPRSIRSGERTANERAPKPEFGDGPFRAVVQWLDQGNESCGDDAMRLIVLEGNRALDHRDYCSAYALGEARAITDAQGRRYVLLEHSDGRGTRATSGFLTIYEFDGDLNERARLLRDEPTGFEALSIYRYRVETPPRGGIVLNGPWRVEGEMRGWGSPPWRSRTLLALDTQG